jgi:hypothetical protein
MQNAMSRCRPACCSNDCALGPTNGTHDSLLASTVVLQPRMRVNAPSASGAPFQLKLDRVINRNQLDIMPALERYSLSWTRKFVLYVYELPMLMYSTDAQHFLEVFQFCCASSSTFLSLGLRRAGRSTNLSLPLERALIGRTQGDNSTEVFFLSPFLFSGRLERADLTR